MRGGSIFTTKGTKKNHYLRIKNETIAAIFVVWRFSFLHFSHPESRSSVAPISHANTMFIFCVFLRSRSSCVVRWQYRWRHKIYATT